MPETAPVSKSFIASHPDFFLYKKEVSLKYFYLFNVCLQKSLTASAPRTRSPPAGASATPGQRPGEKRFSPCAMSCFPVTVPRTVSVLVAHCGWVLT
jgi:hypothetical protein